jgi:hypothetical protein
MGGIMEIKFYGSDIAEIIADGVIIHGVDDVLELLFANNCSSIILKKENVADVFFDLSTGVAGDVLQKFSTYRKRLAIIGDYACIKSKAFQDFIYESNKTKQVLFVQTKEAAIKVFAQ